MLRGDILKPMVRLLLLLILAASTALAKFLFQEFIISKLWNYLLLLGSKGSLFSVIVEALLAMESFFFNNC